MRIFVDCSLVNFRIPPTGIPRVVSNYVKHGYSWAAKHDIEVIPIVPSHAGLLAIYPIPKSGSLESSWKADQVRGPYAIGRQIRSMARRGLYRLDTLLPPSSVNTFLYRLDSRISGWATVLVHRIKQFDANKNLIEPRSGDIIFCPALWHEVDPDVYRNLRERGCIIVLLIHDILPITHPQHYPFPWRDLFRERLRIAFDYTSVFVCVSETTRKSLEDFAIANDRSGQFATAYNGYQPLKSISESSAERLSPDLRRAFENSIRPLLMVGSIEPKKNYVQVIECLEEKWKNGYRRPLVIIGTPGWISHDIVRRIRRSPQFGRMLFWFHDIDDADLDYAYSGCHAHIFASLAEGFGLPMIEASMYRKPTIVYRSDIAIELLSDYGVFFDLRPASLSNAIDAVENPHTYQGLCEALQAFVWPDWQDRSDALYDWLVECNGHWDSIPPMVSPTKLQPIRISLAQTK
jgi:glycosyltransferase involved in cell wall biosynthesis